MHQNKMNHMRFEPLSRKVGMKFSFEKNNKCCWIKGEPTVFCYPLIIKSVAILWPSVGDQQEANISDFIYMGLSNNLS